MTFQVEKLSPTIGGEVRGVDLKLALGDGATTDRIYDALLQHKVLFFRDQDVTRDEHVAFARSFGELEIHPFGRNRDDCPELFVLDHGDAPIAKEAIRENIWHSDVTWRQCPSKASILRALTIPPVGGDTLWSDMEAAYADLDRGMQTLLDGLTAVHDPGPGFKEHMSPTQLAEMLTKFPPVEHPVVRVHPETGRKSVFVNSSFTSRIVGMERTEGDALLRLLYSRSQRPEYQCRFRWRANSVAVWDNRCTQHYAVQDYWPQRRVMERATVIGDRPVGPR
jgi:taurine dioxygenase